MNGNHDDLVDVEELDENEAAKDEMADDELMDEMKIPTADVGEISVEINVVELIAELEANCGTSSKNKEEVPRRRLEDILEKRRAARELKEIDEFSFDQSAKALTS